MEKGEETNTVVRPFFRILAVIPCLVIIFIIVLAWTQSPFIHHVPPENMWESLKDIFAIIGSLFALIFFSFIVITGKSFFAKKQPEREFKWNLGTIYIAVIMVTGTLYPIIFLFNDNSIERFREENKELFYYAFMAITGIISLVIYFFYKRNLKRKYQ